MPETFVPENLKQSIKMYLIKWSIAYGIVMGASTIFLVANIEAIVGGGTVTYSVLTTGINLVPLAGPIAIGVNVAGAPIAIGANAIGIFAIGGNAVGVVAIGGNAIGGIAIGGCPIGVIAVGWRAFGIYSLSYSEKGRGKYLLAPHRQDAKAVAFFTASLPKSSK